ncbi:conserved hypothetical protein [Neospora caninum Liverpool]|uniref:Uncharacterized protein n=1 Tax=Neospora caninum (strain Liverpool) TaxID=572307 RepID=F0VRN4_NEOCL|nr:conserved hypothetical protein [Neospora caninum Liverpool]CBZ56382.1 conserved hypothetical protein [Neospora caninum Liverpool]CEL71142.1 TPA: hypothetical protein BN1204_068060 [Neospora caninum Liverpool]|eukprot:XP_003886407.1 conserved hypothetical protein [Neospora caninum Liverpool]
MDRHRSSASARRSATAGRSPTSLSPSVPRRSSTGNKVPLSSADGTSSFACREVSVSSHLALYTIGDISSVSCERPNRRSTADSRDSVYGTRQPRSSTTSPTYSELRFALSSPHPNVDDQTDESLPVSSAAPLASSASVHTTGKLTIEAASPLSDTSVLPKEAFAPASPPSSAGTMTGTALRKPGRLYPALEPPPSPPPAIRPLTAPEKTTQRGGSEYAVLTSSVASPVHQKGQQCFGGESGGLVFDVVTEEKPHKGTSGDAGTTDDSAAGKEKKMCTSDERDDEKENAEKENIHVAASPPFSVLPAILRAPQFSSPGSGKSGEEASSQKNDQASPARLGGVPTPLRGENMGEDLSGEPAMSLRAFPCASSPVLAGSLRRLSTVSAASIAPGSLLRLHIDTPRRNQLAGECASPVRERTSTEFPRFSPAEQATPVRSLEDRKADRDENECSQSSEGNERLALNATGAPSGGRTEEYGESFRSLPRQSPSLGRAEGSSYSACSSPLLRSPVTLPRSSSPQSSRSSSPFSLRHSSCFSSLPPSSGLVSEEMRHRTASQREARDRTYEQGANIPTGRLGTDVERRSERRDEQADANGGKEGDEAEPETGKEGWSPYRPGSLSAAFRHLQEKQGKGREASPFALRSEGESSCVSLLLTQPVSSPDSELDTPGEAAGQVDEKGRQRPEERYGDTREESRERSFLHVESEERMESERDGEDGQTVTVETREDFWVVKDMSRSAPLKPTVSLSGTEAETKEGTAEDRADRHGDDGQEWTGEKEASQDRSSGAGTPSGFGDHVTRESGDAPMPDEGGGATSTLTPKGQQATEEKRDERREIPLAVQQGSEEEQTRERPRDEDEWYDVIDSSLDETTALNTLKNRSPFTPRRRRLFLRQAGAASGVWTLNSLSDSGQSPESGASRGPSFGTPVGSRAEAGGQAGESVAEEKTLRDAEQSGKQGEWNEKQKRERTHDTDGEDQGGKGLEKGRRASAPEDRRHDSSFGVNLSSPSFSLPLPSRKKPTLAPAAPSPLRPGEEEEAAARKRRKSSPSLAADTVSSPSKAAAASAAPSTDTAEGRTSLDEFESPSSRHSSFKKMSPCSMHALNTSSVSPSFPSCASVGRHVVHEDQRESPEEGGKGDENTPRTKKKVEFGSASVAVFVDSPNSYRSPLFPDRSTPLSDHGHEQQTPSSPLPSSASPASAYVSSSSSSAVVSSVSGPARPSPLEELTRAERCERAAPAMGLPALRCPSSSPSALPLLSPASREPEKPRAADAPKEDGTEGLQRDGEETAQEEEEIVLAKMVEKGVQTPEKSKEPLDSDDRQSACASIQRVPIVVLPTLAESDSNRPASPVSLLSSLSASVQVISVSPELVTVPDKPQQPESGPSSLFRPSPPAPLPASPSVHVSEHSPFSLKTSPSVCPLPLQPNPRPEASSSLVRSPFSSVDESAPRNPAASVGHSSPVRPSSRPSLSAHRDTPSHPHMQSRPSPLPSSSSPVHSSSSPFPSSSSPVHSSSSPFPSSSSPLPSASSPLPSSSSAVPSSSLPRPSVHGTANAASSVSSSPSPSSPFSALDPLNGDEPLSPRLLFASDDGCRRVGTASSLGDYLSSVRSRLLLCGEKPAEAAASREDESEKENGGGKEDSREQEAGAEGGRPTTEEGEQGGDEIGNEEAGNELQDVPESGFLKDEEANTESQLEPEKTGEETEQIRENAEKFGEEERGAEREGEEERRHDDSPSPVEGTPRQHQTQKPEEESEQQGASDFLNIHEVAVYEEPPSVSEAEEEICGNQKGDLSPTQRVEDRPASAFFPLACLERETTRCSTSTGKEETEEKASEEGREGTGAQDARRESTGEGDDTREEVVEEREQEVGRKRDEAEEESTQRLAREEKDHEEPGEQAEEKRYPLGSAFEETAAETNEKKFLTFSEFLEETKIGDTGLILQKEKVGREVRVFEGSSAAWRSALRRVASDWSREALTPGETEKGQVKKTSDAWKETCVAATLRLYQTEEKLLTEAARLCEASHAFVDAAAPRPPCEEDVHRLATEPWGSEISLTVEEKERTLQDKVRLLDRKNEEVDTLRRQIERAEQETEKRAEELLHFSSSNEDLQLLAEIRRKQAIVAAFEQMSCMQILHFNPRGLLVSLSWPKSALPALSSSRKVYLSGEKSKLLFPLFSAFFEREKAREGEGGSEKDGNGECSAAQKNGRDAQVAEPPSASLSNLPDLSTDTRVSGKTGNQNRDSLALSLPAPFPVVLLPHLSSLPPGASSVAPPSSFSSACSPLSWPPPTKVCILWRQPLCGRVARKEDLSVSASGAVETAAPTSPSPAFFAQKESNGFGEHGESAKSGILRVHKLGDSSWKPRREERWGNREVENQEKKRDVKSGGNGREEGYLAASVHAQSVCRTRRIEDRERDAGKENASEKAERGEEKQRPAELYEARLITRFPYLAAQKEEAKNIHKRKGKLTEERGNKRRRGACGEVRSCPTSQSPFPAEKNGKPERRNGVSVQDKWRVEMDRFRRKTMQLAQKGLSDLLLSLQPSLALPSVLGGAPSLPASDFLLHAFPPGSPDSREPRKEAESGGRRKSISSSLAVSASRRSSVCTLGSSVDLSSSVAASSSPLRFAAQEEREDQHRAVESSLPRGRLQGQRTGDGDAPSLEISCFSRVSEEKPPSFFPDMWSVRTLLLQAHTAVGRVALLHDQFLLFLLRFRTLTQVSYLSVKAGASAKPSKVSENLVRQPNDESERSDTGDQSSCEGEREAVVLAVRTALTPQDAEMPSLWLHIEIDLNEAMHRGSLLLGVKDVTVEPIDEEDQGFPDTESATVALLQCLQDHLNSLWDSDGCLAPAGEAVAFKDEVFLQWILHAAIECGYDRTLWVDGFPASTSIGSFFEKKRVLETLFREKRTPVDRSRGAKTAA